MIKLFDTIIYVKIYSNKIVLRRIRNEKEPYVIYPEIFITPDKPSTTERLLVGDYDSAGKSWFETSQ